MVSVISVFNLLPYKKAYCLLARAHLGILGISRLKQNFIFLANDILRVSFDYRNYEMAKKSITGGASFQSILLQSDSTQIENIGIAIYQMHRYYSG